jgi:hypothetical protein
LLDELKLNNERLVHFRVDWRDVMGSSFDVAAFINNAFDAQYIVGGLSVLDSLSWVGQTCGAPRTYGASLRYRIQGCQGILLHDNDDAKVGGEARISSGSKRVRGQPYRETPGEARTQSQGIIA